MLSVLQNPVQDNVQPQQHGNDWDFIHNDHLISLFTTIILFLQLTQEELKSHLLPNHFVLNDAEEKVVIQKRYAKLPATNDKSQWPSH